MDNQVYQKTSRTRALVSLVGTIKITGNTTPANGTFAVEYGEGIASVSRTGAGKYKIVLSDKYTALHSAKLSLEAATSIDLVPQIIAKDVSAATPYVEVVLLAGATATDSANGVVHRIHFEFNLKNSSVR